MSEMELPRFNSISPPNGSAFIGSDHGVRFMIEDDMPIDLFLIKKFSLNDGPLAGGIIGLAPQNDERTVAQVVITMSGLEPDLDSIFEFAYEDEAGNRIESTHYFDTFSPDNPIIEAEDFEENGEPGLLVSIIESTDATRDFVSNDQMVVGLKVGDFFDYTGNIPEENYHVYLKLRLDDLEQSLISFQILDDSVATECGVFHGVNTDGFFRNFQLKNRAGTRPVVVPLNGPSSLRFASETNDPTGDSLFLNYLVFVPTDDPVQSLFLQSSPNVEGPYEDDPNATIDLETGTIRTSLEGGRRFYVIDSASEASAPKPTSITLNEGEIEITFELAE